MSTTSRALFEKDVETYTKQIEDVLKPVESWIAACISLLYWKDRYKSAIALLLVNTMFLW